MTGRPRHVLITGGSRGIGLSIAQLFAKTGYRCTLVSRSEESLKAAVSTLTTLPSAQWSDPAARLSNPSSPKHSYIPGNIAQLSEFWNADSSLPSSFGAYLSKPPVQDSNHPSKIDVLVNCAGVTQAKLFSRTDVRILSATVIIVFS